jgi:hypothetical protein
MTRASLNPLGLPVFLALLLVGAALPAGANPLPSNAIFTHVQTPSPSFCSQGLPFTCEQIVQHTEATGQLEFDIFLWSMMGGMGYSFDAVRVTAQWPASWGFVDADFCGGADGSLDVQGNRLVVDATWLPDCPVLGTGVYPIARIVLDVTGHGELTYLYTEPNDMTWGCPPDEYQEGLGALIGAEAGVECDYCYEACDFDMMCVPHLTPTTLTVEVPRGLTDHYTIDAVVPSYEAPCSADFFPTASWMAVEAQQMDWENYRLTLTVNAQGLELGEYSGWVIGQADCRGCCRVNLTVTDSQGIPDEQPADGSPSGDVTSWGAVKNLYRR